MLQFHKVCFRSKRYKRNWDTVDQLTSALFKKAVAQLAHKTVSHTTADSIE